MMDARRSFLRATVCGAALFSAGVLTTISNNAFAACGTGGQCAVIGGYGSDVTFSGDTYESIFWTPNMTALYAANPGSIINADNVTVTSASGILASFADKVWVENGGTINLTNANVFGGLFGLRATGADSRITMTGGSISVAGNAAWAGGTSTLIFNGVAIATAGPFSAGLDVREDASAFFDSNEIDASGVFSFGAYAADRARLTFTNAGIGVSGLAAIGVGGRDDTSLMFDRTNIAVSGDYGMGIFVLDNAKLDFADGKIEITGADSAAVYGSDLAKLSFDQAQIIASGDRSAGIDLSGNAVATFDNGTIEAKGAGAQGVYVSERAHLSLTNSAIAAEGFDASAILFDDRFGSGSSNSSIVTMENGEIIASGLATAITAVGGRENQLNITDTRIEGGSRLVEVWDFTDPATGFVHPTGLSLNAGNSVMEGGTRVTAGSRLSMNLQNSLWLVRHDATGSGGSRVSTLDFSDSIIRFDAPVGGAGGTYQSLTVGAGNPGTADAYNIGANSHIEMNTFINSGGIWTNQYTDRLFILGNVNGKTLLKINEMAGSSGASTSLHGTNAAHEGISLAQVSGAAQQDSFYLEGGYMTLAGKPYVHRLYAFGPGSSYGAADIGQQQVGGTTHWDYRLQNEFIRNRHGWAVQVVPQVASYLTAPTALFQAGFMDVGNLHNRLGEVRQSAAIEGEEPTKSRGNFFLRGYGGDYDYHSDLSAIHYGYDADIRYAAVQAGGNLYGFDTAGGRMLFGLAGSYGDLAFSPDRLDSRKTSMDVWSAAAYASWLGNDGLYIDTILSYGGFSGSVSTQRYDHTAKLKGNSFTASIEAGQSFALGSDGWSIEPQAQLIYQRLSFDRAHDIDDFAIVLGSPDQWVGRLGGKLSKELAVENMERFIVYGKLNLIHGFSGGDRVFLGDNFHVGEFGTQIEGGLGLNLDMTKNASLYGDVSYQGRVGDGGSNGLSLNGGLRFQF